MLPETSQLAGEMVADWVAEVDERRLDGGLIVPYRRTSVRKSRGGREEHRCS